MRIEDMKMCALENYEATLTMLDALEALIGRDAVPANVLAEAEGSAVRSMALYAVEMDRAAALLADALANALKEN